MGYERTVTISLDHPSLAGHFPGHPVVPGVVMLGEVMDTIQRTMRGRITFVGMPQVKFLSPLSPGEPLAILVEPEGVGSVGFTCRVGSRVVASGTLDYCQDPRGEKGVS